MKLFLTNFHIPIDRWSDVLHRILPGVKPLTPSLRRVLPAPALRIPSAEKVHFAQVIPSFPRQPVSHKWLRWVYKVLTAAILHPTLKAHLSFRASYWFGRDFCPSSTSPLPSQAAFPFLPFSSEEELISTALPNKLSIAKLSGRMFPRKPGLKYRITLCFTNGYMEN